MLTGADASLWDVGKDLTAIVAIMLQHETYTKISYKVFTRYAYKNIRLKKLFCKNKTVSSYREIKTLRAVRLCYENSHKLQKCVTKRI